MEANTTRPSDRTNVMQGTRDEHPCPRPLPSTGLHVMPRSESRSHIGRVLTQKLGPVARRLIACRCEPFSPGGRCIPLPCQLDRFGARFLPTCNAAVPVPIIAIGAHDCQTLAPSALKRPSCLALHFIYSVVAPLRSEKPLPGTCAWRSSIWPIAAVVARGRLLEPRTIGEAQPY